MLWLPSTKGYEEKSQVLWMMVRWHVTLFLRFYWFCAHQFECHHVESLLKASEDRSIKCQDSWWGSTCDTMKSKTTFYSLSGRQRIRQSGKQGADSKTRSGTGRLEYRLSAKLNTGTFCPRDTRRPSGNEPFKVLQTSCRCGPSGDTVQVRRWGEGKHRWQSGSRDIDKLFMLCVNKCRGKILCSNACGMLSTREQYVTWEWSMHFIC